MSKKQPLCASLQQFINELNSISYSAGRHIQDTFRDWLQMIVCSLSMGSMEDLYMKTVKHYSEKGLAQRMASLFGSLCLAMEGRRDMLGDIFMEAVSRGHNGQFFTPMEVCRMMAKMTGVPEKGTPSVHDPACGSGRTLLAVAEHNPRCILVGQDNDHTCVQMLAVNLALNGLSGYAIHGNSLTNEVWAVYKIGMPGIPGVIYRVSYQYLISQFPAKDIDHEEEEAHQEASKPDQRTKRIGSSHVGAQRIPKQRVQPDDIRSATPVSEGDAQGHAVQQDSRRRKFPVVRSVPVVPPPEKPDVPEGPVVQPLLFDMEM